MKNLVRDVQDKLISDLLIFENYLAEGRINDTEFQEIEKAYEKAFNLLNELLIEANRIGL
jgi:hypothetical protein